MRWSFSRCNGIDGCLYNWYLTYLPPLDENGNPVYAKEQNFYASFGKFCHEIFEKCLKGELKKEDCVNYYKENFDKEVMQDSNQVDKYYIDGIESFEHFAEDKFFDDLNIIGVEKECTFKIKDRNFIAYIDVLAMDNAENFIIIDHKSSKSPIGKKGKILNAHKKTFEGIKKQMYIYSLAVFEEYGKYPKTLAWNFFREKMIYQIPFLEEEFHDTIKWAYSQIEKIRKEEDFEPSIDYFFCNNLCSFRNSCEYMDCRETN